MSTAYRQVRLNAEELHQLKQLMGALMALLSFWALASLDVGSGPVILLGIGVALVALVFPGSVSRIPAKIWKFAGPSIFLVILVDFGLHLPEFISPLVRMVILLIIYRVLAPRNQREDLQVILLCLFCLVVSGVMTVSLLFAVQIVLFTPLAMALLFIICILDRGEHSRTHVIQWMHFRWSRFLKRIWNAFDWRVVLLSAAMFAVVVTVSTLLFILTPRFDLNRAIPFLEMSTKAQSGFWETVSLGDVSEILEDDSVALRVDLPSMDALSEEPYWRMLVLDEYNNGIFRMSNSLKTRPLRNFAEKRVISSGRAPDPEREPWTIFMEGGISRYLPIPGDFSSVRFEQARDVELVEGVHVAGLDSVGQSVFSFQVENLQFNRRFEATGVDSPLVTTSNRNLSGEVEDYPMTTLQLEIREESLAVLNGINEQFDLDGLADAAAYSRVATEYLWQNFSYSLAPDVNRFSGRDPVVDWLENGSQGHCELFSASFVLLARQAGFPARMVVGFKSGSWNSIEDFFVVRNRDAHAWVEIFDPVQGNWLRVDPTPGRGSSDPEVVFQRNMQFESGLFAWVDSLRIQWYRRIVNFEQEDQVELARGLKDRIDRTLEHLKNRLAEAGQSLQSFFLSPLDHENIRAAMALLFFVIAGIGIWRLRFTLFEILHKLSGRRASLDPVRLRAARYLRRAQSGDLADPLVRELQALRFGPARTMKTALPVFKRARKAIRRQKKI
jgi:transglutaminase-like putative cysteine protease